MQCQRVCESYRKVWEWCRRLGAMCEGVKPMETNQHPLSLLPHTHDFAPTPPRVWMRSSYHPYTSHRSDSLPHLTPSHIDFTLSHFITHRLDHTYHRSHTFPHRSHFLPRRSLIAPTPLLSSHSLPLGSHA